MPWLSVGPHEPETFLLRPFRWLQAISDHRVTLSHGPNFAYQYCVDKIAAEQRQRLDLSRWKIAIVGAEPVRRSTLDAFAAAFRDVGFSERAFYPCYGLAEATLFVTGDGLGAEAAAEPNADKSVVSCGGPRGEAAVQIVDPTTTRVCAPGEVGEIWISGPNVAQGYWRQAELTRAVFRAVAQGDDCRYLRTGDLGYRIGNELFVTGRLRNMIVVAGRNIHLEDIEHTVARCHAALQLGCCSAFSVEVNDVEQLILVVELNLRALSDLTKSSDICDSAVSLRGVIKAAVTEHHELAVRDIVFVKAGQIPRTSSGKIEHHVCRDRYLAGRFEGVSAPRLITEESAVGGSA